MMMPRQATIRPLARKVRSFLRDESGVMAPQILFFFFMMLLVGGRGRATVERLQGQRLGGFKRVRMWTAPKSDPIPVQKTRLGAADIDYDGRVDLVLFSAHDDKTRIRVLKSRYDRMVQGPDWKYDAPWDDVRPY